MAAVNSAPPTVRPSPFVARTAPFLIFVALTSLQGLFGEASRYWVYAVKTVLGVGMVWWMRPRVRELKWVVSWPALGVGVLVWAAWVGLDSIYPPIELLLKKMLCPVLGHIGLEKWCAAPVKPPTPWNPFVQFSPGLAWSVVLVRWVGSTLIVPPLEEVFYRSFLYRYLAHPDFEQVPLNRFAWTPLLVTSAIFGFSHYEWLPGIVCGLLYQGLVLRYNRLGDAMTAHAITNALLGLWVVWKGAWHFW